LRLINGQNLGKGVKEENRPKKEQGKGSEANKNRHAQETERSLPWLVQRQQSVSGKKYNKQMQIGHCPKQNVEWKSQTVVILSKLAKSGVWHSLIVTPTKPTLSPVFIFWKAVAKSPHPTYTKIVPGLWAMRCLESCSGEHPF
jgi:hypothetical protein